MSKRLTGFLLLLVIIQPAYAAEFYCSSGDVTCLITAIKVANANGEENFISLGAGVYSLTSVDNETDGPNGLPSVVSPLTIVGDGAEATVIERDSMAPDFRIFHVSSAGTLRVDRLIVTGGFGPADTFGGGLFNNGAVTISNSVITRNEVGFRGIGGGLFNRGILSVSNSIIAENQASDRGAGGGLSNQATLTIANSTISSNFAGGPNGPLGGGIENRGALTIINSTISGNEALGGGGIFNDGTVNITNSTLTSNIGSAGGGIRNLGNLTIVNSTIANNRGSQGAGIFSAGLLELQNTVLAVNTAAQFGPDCFGPVTSAATSLGNNLIGDPTGCSIDLLPSDLTGDPGLGDFIDDGTPGRGHFKPLVGSPLIDSANPDACPQNDQLGFSRIGTCDIGSVEFQGSAVAVVAIDIRPGGEANRINPNRNKEIRVAILSGDSFDATTIDPARFSLVQQALRQPQCGLSCETSMEMEILI
jgi:hypothetical protein